MLAARIKLTQPLGICRLPERGLSAADASCIKRAQEIWSAGGRRQIACAAARGRRQSTTHACAGGSSFPHPRVPASQSLLRRPSRAPAGGQLALAGTGHGGDLRALLAHQEREELVTLWTNSWIEFWQTTGAPRRLLGRCHVVDALGRVERGRPEMWRTVSRPRASASRTRSFAASWRGRANTRPRTWARASPGTTPGPSRARPLSPFGRGSPARAPGGR